MNADIKPYSACIGPLAPLKHTNIQCAAHVLVIVCMRFGSVTFPVVESHVVSLAVYTNVMHTVSDA